MGNITHKLFVVPTPEKWNEQREIIEARGKEFYDWEKRPEGYIPARELGTNNYVAKCSCGIELISDPKKLLEDGLSPKVKIDLRKILKIENKSLDDFAKN